MTDDSSPPTADKSGEKGPLGILLGAAACGALTWLERREKARQAANPPIAAPPPPHPPPAPRPAPDPPAATAAPAAPGHLRTPLQVATVVREERTIPYKIPISQGGITMYYDAGTLSSTVAYSAVLDDRGPRRGRVVAGPCAEVEEMRDQLRAGGWERVPGGAPERWERRLG